MRFPLPELPFPDVSVSREQSDEYALAAEGVLARTLEDFDSLIRCDHRVLNPKEWRPVKTRDDVTVYRQHSRRRRAAVTTPGGSSQKVEWKMPQLLATGTIAGSLDDIMYGIVSPDAPSIAVKAAYVSSGIVDGAVLHTIEDASSMDPFHFVGLKWFVIGVPLAINALAASRDLVYVEATGIRVLADGSRVGYHVTHSIDHPQCPELTSLSIVRARHSNCYLYHQQKPGVVEVYMSTKTDPGGNVPESVAIKAATNVLISVSKAARCSQKRKLTRLLSSEAELARFRDDIDFRPTNAKSCYLCHSRVRSYRGMKPCVLCEASVCGRCCVQRRLYTVEKRFQLSHRDVQVCKRCIVLVTTQDATQFAREDFVHERDHARREMNRCIVKPLQLPDPTTVAAEVSPLTSEATTASPASEWAEPEAGEAPLSDDWAQQTRRLPPSAYPSTTSSSEAPRTASSLLAQMQRLCLTAEETYLLTSMNASHVRGFATVEDGKL